MKTPAKSTLLTAFLILCSCSKPPTPVSPVPEQTAAPPSPSHISVADQEALKQVKNRFATHYRQQGDSWRMEDGDDSIEVRQPSFSIVSFPLSEIDKLNGYEYRGKAIVRFAASRYAASGVTANGGHVPKQWHDWTANGQNKIEVRKQRGAWKFWVLDPWDREEEKRDW